MIFFFSIILFFSAVQLYGTASRGEKIDVESYAFEGNNMDIITVNQFGCQKKRYQF